MWKYEVRGALDVDEQIDVLEWLAIGMLRTAYLVQCARQGLLPPQAELDAIATACADQTRSVAFLLDRIRQAPRTGLTRPQQWELLEALELLFRLFESVATPLVDAQTRDQISATTARLTPQLEAARSALMGKPSSGRAH